MRAGEYQRGLLRFEVESLECSGAHLTLETSKPGKLPLEFAIAHLKLTGIGDGGAMGFEAELTNPRPVGTIHTKGSFGPWLVDDPGESPITGDYRFEHADLSGFKGIAGILNSTGHYQGTLRDLVVDGETDTPDFRLTPLRHGVAAAHEVSREGGRDQRGHMAGAGGSDAGALALLDAGADCAGGCRLRTGRMGRSPAGTILR